jgi:pimeloyl-ACP methyl ester carboxylesterase
MRSAVALLAAISSSTAFAASFVPGLNPVGIRGRQQDIYFLPSASPARGRVLFTPGDGGWRGAAIQMAREISQSGFDVYGWDVRKYLSGFTSDRATLSEAEVRDDVLTICRQIGGQVLLVGWSQGAAMSVLAAPGAPPAAVRGVLAVGLPASGVLGWRLRDDLTYVTKREPDEPKFQTSRYVSLLNSVPFCLIQAEMDEYTPSAISEQLFSSVTAPKQKYRIAGSKHSFRGHEQEFYGRLREALEWLVSRQ